MTNITAMRIAKNVPFSAWSDAPHIALFSAQTMPGDSRSGSSENKTEEHGYSDRETLVE